jgi:uncharacterized protein YbcI
MGNSDASLAQRIAGAACELDHRLTGRVPQFVTAVLTDDTLVIAVHGALSSAERAQARTRAGAAEVREYHRRLFADSFEGLRQHIERISGLKVSEAAAEVDGASGTVVKVFTTGPGLCLYLPAYRSPETHERDDGDEQFMTAEVNHDGVANEMARSGRDRT